MGSLNEAFFKPELIKLLKEMRAPQSAKKSFYELALHHHVNCSTQCEAVKSYEKLFYRIKWSWPRGQDFLIAQGDDCESEDIIGLIHHRLTMAAHQLYRRGQMRALLSSKMGHVILVSADAAVAPCGYRNGETLVPSNEVLKKFPPCEHLDCSCAWTLMRPQKNSSLDII